MAHPRFFRWKNSVLIKWILSYLLILAVPIALGSVLLKNAHTLLVNEYNLMNATIQKEISRRLDDYIAEVTNFSTLLSRNTLINAFIQKPAPCTLEDRRDLVEIAGHIQSYHYFSAINTCYLYINNADTIVTTHGLASRELFRQEVFRDEPLYYVDLDSYINSYQANSIDLVEMPEGKPPRLMLVKSLPVDAYGQPKATLFQIFSEDALPNLLESVSSDGFAQVMLLDSGGRVISGNSPQEFQVFPEAERMTKGSGQLECTVSGEEQLVFYSEVSALKGFRCVMMISAQSIQEKTGPLRQSSLLFIALSIAMGSALAFFLLCQNYRPVRRILHEITPYADSSSQDAFEQISRTFQSVVSANQEWNRVWKQQEQFLQERFLESVFLGNVTDTPITREILSSFSITFPGSCFCVLLFSMAGGTPEGAERLFGQFQESLLDRWSGASLYSAQINGVRTVLVNLDGSPDTYRILCEECRLFAEDRRFFWVLSRLCVSLDTVSVCYHEAAECLRQKQRAYQKEGRFAAEPTFQQAEPEGFGVTPQLEEQFLQRICLGDADGAMECFRSGWAGRGMNGAKGTRYQSFAYGMANAVWRAVRQLPEPGKPLRDGLTRMTNGFLTAAEPPEAQKQMKALLDLLCSTYRQKPEEETEQPLIREIIQCVDAHYSEVDFNATQLAGYLGKNLSYLSKIFKNTTGVGLHDYINRIRINRGKQLLSEKHLSITEVAQQVGFDNLNSFIRVFKKFEAITPGSYRPKK